MRRDDRDDPFDEFFEEIERMMNEMMSGNAQFHFEHNSGNDASPGDTGVHHDIHETEDSIRVVADLPGVTKNDIDLKCDGTTLHLDAAGDERSYRERIDMPTPVDEHSANATYNNGILEVTFDSADDSTSIDL